MTEPMREGLLLEGYLLNKFKDDNEKELVGRKKPVTIDFIKNLAAKIRPIFIGGEAFVKIEHETDNRIYQGEIDYLGIIELPDKTIFDGINDIKKTGSIDWVWDELNHNKLTYLQGSYYPYLLWLNTGIWKDFCYIIIEDKYLNPIISFRIIRTSQYQEKVIEFYENLFGQIEKDLIKPALPSTVRCLKPYRCAYLEYCEEGRALLGGIQVFDWDELKEVSKPNWAEVQYYSAQLDE